MVSVSPMQTLGRLLLCAAITSPATGQAATLASVPTSVAPEPPRTPRGLASCQQPLAPLAGPVGSPGERLEYGVALLGIGVGSVEMEATRRGRFRGEPVTEYRAQMHVTGIVSAFVDLEGEAASLVPDASLVPVQATLRYRFESKTSAEQLTFSAGGREVATRRRDDKGTKERVRAFAAPVQDVLSAFYLLRRLPPVGGGCSVISADGKAFTAWIEPEGPEQITTAFGRRDTVRYHLRYGGDDESLVKDARVWVGTDEQRLPYRIEGLNRFHPVADLRDFRPGI